ncbi:MAG: carboxypeptidase regulatory-like domain-containing protein [Bryobacteraceae bacterium]
MKVIVLLGCYAAFAQEAQVSGLVRDGSAAVMPEVQIAIVNQDTGLRRGARTNAAGLYAVSGIKPGVYKVTARRPGFQTLTRMNIKLDVAQAARVDFRLPISVLGESVTVSDGSALPARIDATVSTVINRQFVENLPLNGRSLQSLIALTPGVVMTKATFGEQGQFSVNGQRANANYFTLDGVSANIGVSAGLTLVQSSSGSLPGLGATGGTNTLVSVEALEEFRVQTSSYPAEYGRMPGAQVTMLTRSGTNRVHGALFDYFRNDALDANDWFANAERLPKPALRQNDFGGVIGGPIRKDRTFFFGSYEGLRLRQPQVQSTDVPTLSARERSGRSTRKYLDAFPLPNRPPRRFDLAAFVASYTDSSTLDAASLRVDHLFGTRATVFGRYNHAPSNAVARRISLNNPTTTVANTDTLTAGATWMIGPRLTNELRFNRSYTTGESFSRLDDFGGAKPLAPEDFFPASVDATNSFGGLTMTGGVNTGWYLGKNVANSQRQWNVVNHFSLAEGAHYWKFGVDGRQLATRNNPRAYDQFFSFVGTAGAIFGQTAQTALGAQEDITVHVRNWSFFAQDTWKARPRLTVSYGLRWEVNPAPSGSKPLYTYLTPEDRREIRPAPVGTPLYRTDWRGFGPQAGMAWQVSPREGRETTLRAGWGMFYDLGAGIIGQAAAGFPYFRQRIFLQGTSFPLPEELAKPPEFSLTPPIAAIYGASRGLRLPATYQWNVTLERALGRSRVASVGYVGGAEVTAAGVLGESERRYYLCVLTA